MADISQKATDTLRQSEFITGLGQGLQGMDVHSIARWVPVEHADLSARWPRVPILASARLTGFLDLNKTESRRFRPEHVRLATAFARRAVLACESSCLVAAERQSCLKPESIQITTSAPTAEPGLDTLLDRIVVVN